MAIIYLTYTGNRTRAGEVLVTVGTVGNKGSNLRCPARHE